MYVNCKEAWNMKMKSVCEKTGLTDRAVRYYIEEELLSPSFDENHTGRRSFDFSEKDVETLLNISVLRKFGFSVSEIRTMTASPDKINEIIEDLKQRKKQEIETEQKLLDALAALESEDYTMGKLSEKLKKPAKNLPAPKDAMKWSFFNRKTLIVLNDAAECMLIKDRLKRAGIPYFFKTTTSRGFWGNTASVGAAMRTYSAGVSHVDMEGPNYYVYYFYVSRKNYAKAKSVIRKK